MGRRFLACRRFRRGKSRCAIADEAERKGAELVESRVNQQAELRSMRYEERVKFRNELREILRVHGNHSRDEIDRLAKRHGFDASDELMSRANSIWLHGRMSPPAKVRLIRSLGVPESLILDFLSDNLHGRVKSRGGPRNEDEVRVRAARQLLSFELPPPPEGPQPVPSRGPVSNRPPAKASVAPATRGNPPGS